MKIHTLARFPHLVEHLAPIHSHLPDQLRGEIIMQPQPRLSDTKHWDQRDLVLVANYADIDAAGGRRVVYVEHGAGQRYEGARPAAAKHYHGSEHPENVIGYLGPRQDVIDSWGRPGFACGAPVCDPYQLFSAEKQFTVAVTFHWNGGAPHRVGVPEAGTAFDHYHPWMPLIVETLRARGWRVWGHHHPRFTHLRGYWERMGVWYADAATVREKCHLLIADNTSMLYEMMYLGRDVIALNAPEWRRDIEHGLRFWEHAPKVQADDAHQLLDVISRYDEIRNRTSDLCDWGITSYVYGTAHSDGGDGRRAATWLTQLAHSL